MRSEYKEEGWVSNTEIVETDSLFSIKCDHGQVSSHIVSHAFIYMQVKQKMPPCRPHKSFFTVSFQGQCKLKKISSNSPV